MRKCWGAATKWLLPLPAQPHGVLLLRSLGLSPLPQVCEAATKHFAAAQPSLAFLQDVQPPAAGTESGIAQGSSSGAQPEQAGDAEWIAKAASVDLVWLYFALYKHYHHGK